MTSITGIEITHLKSENGSLSKIYIDKETLEFSFPSSNISRELNFFDVACEYIKKHVPHIICCESAQLGNVFFD